VSPLGIIIGFLFVLVGGLILKPHFFNKNNSTKVKVSTETITFLRIIPRIDFCHSAYAKKSKKNDNCTAGQCLGDSDCNCGWKCRKPAGAQAGDTGTCGQ
jgi:hypothetical protein